MNVTKKIAALVAMAMLAGCASFSPAPLYVPRQAGNMGDGDSGAGVVVVLKPDRVSIHRGELLGLSVAIRNVGAEAIILPRKPDTLLTWIYPDGRHDNVVRDTAEVAGTELAKLEPGQEIVQHATIKTYYFNRSGITEFRAIVSAAGPANCWTGRVASNGFGIMVD